MQHRQHLQQLGMWQQQSLLRLHHHHLWQLEKCQHLPPWMLCHLLQHQEHLKTLQQLPLLVMHHRQGPQQLVMCQ
jgi:hypothetical protein